MNTSVSILSLSFAAITIFATAGSPTTVAQAQPAVASAPQSVEVSPYVVIERGPHHRIWARVTTITNNQGRILYRTNSYTELGTGLNYLSNGKWMDSNDKIEITPAGGQAVAGQHKVVFSGQLNTAGAIDLTTPDSKHLRSHVLGLSYFDTATGKSTLIAELRDSQGQLLPTGNQVLYPDAFTDFRADVLYTYTKAGFEQDIILREQPPSPKEFGLNPETTVLQVLTEFIDPPQATIERESEKFGASDALIHFGQMRIGRGKAFLIGNEPVPGRPLPVKKHWQTLEGRQFLIEEVPVPLIAPQLQSLPIPEPPAQGAGVSPILHRTFQGHRLPPPKVVRDSHESIRLARNTTSEKGFVLDYTTLNSTLTNYTFQSDSTYYLNEATITGTSLLEGGTVLKFPTNDPGLASESFVFATGPYHMAILTAKDDNTVGETISGSTGVPSGYYAFDALHFSSDSSSESGDVIHLAHDLRISYARTALFFDQVFYTTPYDIIQDVQILHSYYAVSIDGTAGEQYLTFRNGLISDAQIAFQVDGCGGVVEHVTVDKCFYFADDGVLTFTGLYVTNSILVNATNVDGSVGVTGDHNGFYNTTPFGTAQYTASGWPFQTIGAANYYLPNNGSFSGAGTTNISTNTLADLAQKTTYPPVVFFEGAIHTNNLALSPQAPRDTGIPSLGYHYDPIDFAFGIYYITNASITVAPGTALAVFGTNGWSDSYGLAIGNGASLECQGSPNSPVRIVQYNCVQEELFTNWNRLSYAMVSTEFFGHPPACNINCRFTDFAVPAQDAILVRGVSGSCNPMYFQDCQFQGGNLYTFYAAMNFTNCLLERINAEFWSNDGNVPWFRNNLIFGGTFDFDPTPVTNAVVKDNLFDHATIPDESWDYSTYTGGYNAFVTNCNRLFPTNVADILITNSPPYQVGPLGSYYYPSSYALINAGSTNANLVGLFQYCTTTNEVKETNSMVDVGFHYVAVSNGIPISTGGSGIPDYLADSNGNGVYDATIDLSNWQTNNTSGSIDGVSDYLKWIQGRNIKVAALPVADTNNLVGLQVYTPLH